MTMYSISYNIAPSIKQTQIYSVMKAVRHHFPSKSSGRFICMLAPVTNLPTVCTKLNISNLVPVQLVHCPFIWTSQWHHAGGIHHPDVQSDIMWHWCHTMKILVTHFDTVSKPATCSKASTESQDTQLLFKRLTPAPWKPTHSSELTPSHMFQVIVIRVPHLFYGINLSLQWVPGTNGFIP